MQNDAPEFQEITDINILKNKFINYLLPKLVKQNQKITELREKIKNKQLSQIEINQLSKKYNVKKDKLLDHIDIIPPSLSLAQAAIESNWGRSRFAQYNNYYGIWCFVKGCGIIPKKRNKGSKHEVAIFLTIADGISYYKWNLNKNYNYQKLRDIRKNLRSKNLTVSGLKLADGLEKYSGIGHNYIQTVKNVIKYNNLTKYD